MELYFIIAGSVAAAALIVFVVKRLNKQREERRRTELHDFISTAKENEEIREILVSLAKNRFQYDKFLLPQAMRTGDEKRVAEVKDKQEQFIKEHLYENRLNGDYRAYAAEHKCSLDSLEKYKSGMIDDEIKVFLPGNYR